MEILDNSEIVCCKNCSGTGMLRTKRDEKNEPLMCPSCNGTGVWQNESYILIAEQPNRQKIAFDVDQGNK